MQSKDKGRAYPPIMKVHHASSSSSSPLSSLSPSPEDVQDEPKKKNAKRAITRQCPVCMEHISVRQLATHEDWEMQRLEELNSRTPSLAPLEESLDYGVTMGEAAPSTRRAAARARHTITPRSAAPRSMLESLTTEAEKTIRFLQTRRRKRHARAKEISRSILGDLDQPSTSVSASNSSTCPVCGIVPRDEVMDEHIDRCLAETAASEAFRAEVANAERQFQQPIGDTYTFGGEARVRFTSLTGYAGTGFSIRDRTLGDVDDELDIEGDDEDTFGATQFNEGDLLPLRSKEDEMVDIDDALLDEDSLMEEAGVEDSPMVVAPTAQVSRARSLRDLVSAGEVVRRPLVHDNESKAIDLPNGISDPLDGIAHIAVLEQEILNAEMKGDKDALVAFLKRKTALLESRASPRDVVISPISPSADASSSKISACRICLESYTEPTVSVACWHVFCKTCWLQCLGTTKLCPICKHISAASNLRRIYL